MTDLPYRCVVSPTRIELCPSPSSAVALFQADYTGIRDDVVEVLWEGHWLRVDYYKHILKRGMATGHGRQLAFQLAEMDAQPKQSYHRKNTF